MGQRSSDHRRLRIRAESGCRNAGLLLSRATHRFDTNGTVLRGVFAPGDRWEVVPQLFVRDVDNDLWLVSALDR